MKKLVKVLMLIAVFGLGILIGANTNKPEKVNIVRVEYESQDDVYLEKGQKYIELSDGSFYIYGNGTYMFQPVDLGDWDYELKSYDDLMKVVSTYLSMKNNGWY